MKAILMAAGMGSRISRKVYKPKSLLEVENTSILGNTVKMLVENGIEVAVVVGYKKEEIFKDLEGLPVKYYFNPFYKVTNSMASLWFAQDFLSSKEDVILANADVYWEQSILDRVISDQRKTIMLGDKSRVLEGDYFFYVEKDGKLAAYGKELKVEERNSEYVGIARLKGSVVDNLLLRLNELVEKEVYNMWWENVLYDFREEFSVYVKDISEFFWAEVDYIEDYERILKYIEAKKSATE